MENVSMSAPDAREAVRMLERLYARIVKRRPVFDERREYFEGRQPLKFATEEWKSANASRYVDFADNWTGPVAAAEAERINHIGVKLDESEYGKAADELWSAWKLNEMEMQSSQGFLSTLVSSRTFVLVWGTSDGEPEITWETGNSAEIEYDWYNPRKRVAAVKSWADEDKEYATLYTKTHLWKFERPHPSKKDDHESQAEQARVISSEGGWLPRVVTTEPWPLSNPLDEVPMVEMPNRPILGGDPISEISGVMSMQDAINLLWAYLFLAADYASMDARIITGTAPPKMPIMDAEGQVVGGHPVPMKELYEKRIAFFEGNDVKAQSFPKASLAGFLEVIDQAVGHISSQTRTPPTYLVSKVGMSNVNSQGLKASEIGLVRKVIEFQRFISPALREVYRLVALAKGDKALAQAARIATIRWANPEIRSEAELADFLVKKKSIGYPLEYLMELDGLDPETIERVIAMREQEMVDPQIDAAARELQDAGQRGDAIPSPAADLGRDGSSGSEAVASSQ